ncbi:hypothetical protein EV193_103463 [Herbihabitans rhizosphaerae]|uniref:Copper(I)-binding protein n=2 Tax=Herbihabitans rhizosphaerae TaxID=1872711 RepID=A0A4V2ETI0_9PSEU|nr:hypothetical protein EV193_103463 [Herbihabitans rhizosphaerae]
MRTAVVAIGLAALLGAAGCGSGQITQTDTQLPAVNGAFGQVGPIVVRNAQVAFPNGSGHPKGGKAPLIVTIVNTGSGEARLTGVSSPAGAAVITGDQNLPAGRAIVAGKEFFTKSSGGMVGDGHGDHGAAATTTPQPTTTPTTTGHAPASTGVPTSGVTVLPTSTTPKTVIGELHIVLTDLAAPIRSGQNVPVTFEFAGIGSVTVEIPVAVPAAPREEPADHGGGGH